MKRVHALTLGFSSLVVVSLLCMSFGFAPYGDSSNNSERLRLTIPREFPPIVYNLDSNPPTLAGFALGRELFYDPIMSADYMTSCASCHQRFAAFAHVDHALSHAVIGASGNRNVPALQNLAWKPHFMHDGGITHLDLQPIAPITNPIELNETLDHVLVKLRADTVYPRMFAAAFGDSAITTARMLRAFSQFLVMLVSADSRYDKMMRHEIEFTVSEQRGLQLFRSACGACHTEPLFSDNSFRNIGLDVDTSLHDLGRARITGRPTDNNAFAVPSLRNVERTFPYMHDGRFRTLRQVLDFYTNVDPRAIHADAALAPTRHLSEFDKDDLIAFLKTLTDQTFLRDPRFADPHPRQ